MEAGALEFGAVRLGRRVTVRFRIRGKPQQQSETITARGASSPGEDAGRSAAMAVAALRVVTLVRPEQRSEVQTQTTRLQDADRQSNAEKELNGGDEGFEDRAVANEAFEVVSTVPALPCVLASPADFLEIEIAFQPSAIGFHASVLSLLPSAPSGSDAREPGIVQRVSLRGRGTGAVDQPVQPNSAPPAAQTRVQHSYVQPLLPRLQPEAKSKVVFSPTMSVSNVIAAPTQLAGGTSSAAGDLLVSQMSGSPLARDLETAISSAMRSLSAVRQPQTTTPTTRRADSVLPRMSHNGDNEVACSLSALRERMAELESIVVTILETQRTQQEQLKQLLSGRSFNGAPSRSVAQCFAASEVRTPERSGYSGSIRSDGSFVLPPREYDGFDVPSVPSFDEDEPSRSASQCSPAIQLNAAKSQFMTPARRIPPVDTSTPMDTPSRELLAEMCVPSKTPAKTPGDWRRFVRGETMKSFDVGIDSELEDWARRHEQLTVMTPIAQNQGGYREATPFTEERRQVRALPPVLQVTPPRQYLDAGHDEISPSRHVMFKLPQVKVLEATPLRTTTGDSLDFGRSGPQSLRGSWIHDDSLADAARSEERYLHSRAKSSLGLDDSIGAPMGSHLRW